MHHTVHRDCDDCNGGTETAAAILAVILTAQILYYIVSGDLSYVAMFINSIVLLLLD
jgi:hypothetical protein